MLLVEQKKKGGFPLQVKGPGRRNPYRKLLLGFVAQSRVGWIALFDDRTSFYLDQGHSTLFPRPIAMHAFGITWKIMDGFTS